MTHKQLNNLATAAMCDINLFSAEAQKLLRPELALHVRDITSLSGPDETRLLRIEAIVRKYMPEDAIVLQDWLDAIDRQNSEAGLCELLSEYGWQPVVSGNADWSSTAMHYQGNLYAVFSADEDNGIATLTHRYCDEEGNSIWLDYGTINYETAGQWKTVLERVPKVVSSSGIVYKPFTQKG